MGFDAGRVSIYSVLPTLLEGMGPAALPLLLDVLDRGDLGEEKRQYVLGLIAELPTDEAFKGLLGRLDRRGVRPVLQAMARRFPVRALRLLAEAAPVSFDAALLLADHLSADAELAAAALRRLPPGTRTAAESAMASLARVPEAPAEAVPAVLAGPAGPRSRPVLEELQAPAPRVAWGAGERRQWLEDVPDLLPVPPDADWKALIGEFRSGTPSISIAQLVVYGPEELAWPPDEERDRRAREEVPWLKPLVARHGLRALPVAVEMAEADPAHCGTALLPFWHADVALMAAGWLTRGGDRADTARRWLDRHGPAAAPLLAPAALGKTAERRPAEWALRYLLLRHDLEEIVRAAQAVHGRRAADALEALLSAHPVETGLCPTPKIGDWLDPASLPQVLLRDRRLALPAAAAERLVALLALPFPHGVREIRRACDPRSLARFGWALLRQWREGGAPAQDDWALTQLAWTGNEETVEQLAALIPLWAEEGRHKDAAKALGVLADIGSDAALKHLHDVPRKATSKKLRQEAQRGMRRIAGRRGLSAEQLADRTVPDLGLAVDGGLVLDYGPRRFTVDLDERFKPVVTDQKGRTRKTPPSPGAKDDLLLAPAAHQRFTAFRKEARGRRRPDPAAGDGHGVRAAVDGRPVRRLHPRSSADVPARPEPGVGERGRRRGDRVPHHRGPHARRRRGREVHPVPLGPRRRRLSGAAGGRRGRLVADVRRPRDPPAVPPARPAAARTGRAEGGTRRLKRRTPSSGATWLRPRRLKDPGRRRDARRSSRSRRVRLGTRADAGGGATGSVHRSSDMRSRPRTA